MKELIRYRMSEWGQRDLPNQVLSSESDRQLAQELSKSNRLLVEEMREGLRIASRSWVGIVRFGSFEVEIRPKLAGDYLGLVALIEFATGVGLFRMYPDVIRMEIAGDNLLELLSQFYACHCEILLRKGLIEDYREFEDDLPVLRGRLLGDRQLLERFGAMDRLVCRYEERTGDIPENQLIAMALDICAREVRNRSLISRLNRLRFHLHSVCAHDQVDLPGLRRSISYHRLNQAYAAPHKLAWLILQGAGFTDFYRPSQSPCFSFLLNMAPLFELFLQKWISFVLDPAMWEVRPQQSTRNVIRYAGTRETYSSIRPDLLVTRRSHPRTPPMASLPLDAKYKTYDFGKLSTSDIYQAFLYSFGFGDTPGSQPVPGAVVMYPASSPTTSPVVLEIVSGHGRIGGKVVAAAVHVREAVAEGLSGVRGVQAQRTLEALRSAGLPVDVGHYDRVPPEDLQHAAGR